jgi:hypothetical protein
MTDSTVEPSALYAALSAPFDETHTDVRGGVEVTFITGEQCATRCNEVLGVGHWYTKIIEHGIHPEADEVWVLTEMGAYIDDQWVVHQQFGSQKIKRSRSTGAPLDIGFDLKGGATDAFKKCASLFGIALYLSHKRPPAQRGNNNQRQQSRPQQRQAFTSDRARGAPYKPGTSAQPSCEQCGELLAPMTFDVIKNGRSVPVTWSVQELARISRRNYTKVLCERDFRAARAASPREKTQEVSSATS